MASRRSETVARLREALQRRRESLADQFEFKAFLVIEFLEKEKRPLVFEALDMVPSVTSDYDHVLAEGVQKHELSAASRTSLLERDTVQLHSRRYRPVRDDIPAREQPMDFILYPRRDIARVGVRVLSRWCSEQGANASSAEAFRELLYTSEGGAASWTFPRDQLEDRFLRLLGAPGDGKGLVVSNDAESLCLFVDRDHVTTATGRALLYRLKSVCVYVPQDRLTHWGALGVDDVLGNCVQ